MRALVRSTITSDATLTGLGVVAGAVLAGDVDTPVQRPFLNLRWGGVDPGLSTVNRGSLTVWVHDNPGDYEVRINPILLRVRELLLDLVGQQHSMGWVVVVEWNGDSEDLIDDGHGTIARNASFTLVGSGQ